METAPKENKPEPAAPVKEESGLELPSTLAAEPTVYNAAAAAGTNGEAGSMGDNGGQLE